jgi:hypothetical protein
MSTQRPPLVLMTQLSERVSANGTRYLSGYLGKARLVGFLDKDKDQYGNSVFKLFVQDNPSCDTHPGGQDKPSQSERELGALFNKPL